MTFRERKYAEEHLSRYEILRDGFKFKMFGVWFKLLDKETYEIEPCDEPKRPDVPDGLPF